MAFQDILKQIQNLLYLLKSKCFTFSFQHQFHKTHTVLKDLLLNWLNEKQPMKDCFWTKIRFRKVGVFVLQCCHAKNILTNNLLLLFLEIKKQIFYPFQDFQDHGQHSKIFLSLFPLIPRLSRTVSTLISKPSA